MKYIACIGNFDGVHTGHQQLIKKCKELAKDKFLTAAITFDPDPATVYGKDPKRKSICNNKQKEELLYQFGIDEIITIPFTKDVALIPKDKFIEFFLNHFDLDTLVCGPDYSFGHRGEGKVETLINSTKKNFKVEVVDFLTYNDEKISSTLIRETIKKGDIKLANELLGYQYQPIISITNGVVTSENLLPESGEYEIMIDGWHLQMLDNHIDYKDCKGKQIRFIY